MNPSNELASVPVRRESQASRIARTLIERIRSGQYPLGSRLPSERVLATEFAVSRPVIREALSTVSAMDLLDIQRGSGAFVTALPEDEGMLPGTNLQDVVNVREVLETGALEMCGRGTSRTRRAAVQVALDNLAAAVAERAETADLDRILHREIINAAESPLLASMWVNLEREIQETIRISPHGRTMSESILTLHRILANGVLTGDTDAAEKASRELHEDNRQFLRRLLG